MQLGKTLIPCAIMSDISHKPSTRLHCEAMITLKWQVQYSRCACAKQNENTKCSNINDAYLKYAHIHLINCNEKIWQAVAQFYTQIIAVDGTASEKSSVRTLNPSL